MYFYPKKLVDFNLANEIWESGNAVCVMFVWTIFLREFPPILGTDFFPPKRCPFEKSAPFCLEKMAKSGTHV